MPIVGGLDIHRKQLTFDYLDTVTGEVKRGQNGGRSRSRAGSGTSLSLGHRTAIRAYRAENSSAVLLDRQQRTSLIVAEAHRGKIVVGHLAPAAEHRLDL